MYDVLYNIYIFTMHLNSWSMIVFNIDHRTSRKYMQHVHACGSLEYQYCTHVQYM